MPVPSKIMQTAAAHLNDQQRQIFTDENQLEYLNQALRDLQENLELYSIPVTYETSTTIEVDAGVTEITYGGLPALPDGLVEINRAWESSRGQNDWIPMVKKTYIPHYLEGVQVQMFGIWAWVGNSIRVPSSNQNNDIKLDYVSDIFPEVAIGAVDVELGRKFKNMHSYLGYRTAALCAMFIGENETRAAALDAQANMALSRSLGISIKGQQSITTRRRPFRASYKRRSGIR